MFNALRKKLKGWTEKISKSKKEEPAQLGEKPKKSRPRIEKPAKKEKKETPKKEKKPEKEISLPVKFNAGMEKFEPDLEKLKEKSEEIKKEKDKIDQELEKSPPEEEKSLLEKTKDELEEKEEEINEEAEQKPREEKAEKEKKSFFQSLVQGKFQKIKISEKDFENYREDLEMLLLENNVAFEVAEKIIKSLKEKIVGREILKKEMESEIKDSLRDIISEILIEPFDLMKEILDKREKSKEPFAILFFGINGSGKTTTIAKISELLKKKKISTVMAAADTFRAASIEQLKEHGKKLGIKVIAHDYGSDPASVGFDAVQYAKKNHIDCVLIDTAGRMHTEKNLIHEMEKISKVCKPDLKIFIGESITGNDATEQAKTFNENIGIDGIVLSKTDIDEKGGTALSVGFITGKPIIFLGTGQNYKDIEYFDKNKFLDRLGLE